MHPLDLVLPSRLLSNLLEEPQTQSYIVAFVLNHYSDTLFDYSAIKPLIKTSSAL